MAWTFQIPILFLFIPQFWFWYDVHVRSVSRSISRSFSTSGWFSLTGIGWRFLWGFLWGSFLGWLLLVFLWLFGISSWGSILLWSSHTVPVSGGNTDEVGEEEHKNDGFCEHGENPGLLWLLGVDISWDVTHSSVEFVLLVNEYEVDQVPDSNQGNRYESKDLWGHHKGSSSSGVLNEPRYNKVWGDQKWAEEEEAYENVPPVEVFVQEQEEVPDEEDHSNGNGKDTEGNHTASDWEASAAWEVLDEFVCANANAAAAWLLDWWGVRIVRVIGGLILLFFFLLLGGFLLGALLFLGACLLGWFLFFGSWGIASFFSTFEKSISVFVFSLLFLHFIKLILYFKI